LLDGLLAGLRPFCLQSFILGQRFMGQLRLEITDGDLRLLKRSLSAFSRHGLGSDGLPGGVRLVGAGLGIPLMIPANDGDWHLVVTDESTPWL
jgi:hypothetical protein